MRHRDLWLFVKSNGTSGMKRNGVPHQLDLMCRNATSFQKRARRVGSIDLEALARSSGRSVPDRAGPPRPPKARDRERVSSLLQSVAHRVVEGYGSDEFLADSIASQTRGVSTTLIPD